MHAIRHPGSLALVAGVLRVLRAFALIILLAPFAVATAWSQENPAPQFSRQVVDLPTRPGATQRFIYLAPPHPVASVILFSGGDGILRISPEGKLDAGRGNFLVRTRQLFVKHGFAVAVVDAPSDRQSYPFLTGFRETPQHVEDIKAVMAWLRQQSEIPVWLVGTSRGTQSAAFISTQLDKAGGGPDGLVLTSTLLRENRGGSAVPDMPLQRLRIPVLVLHHEQDNCKVCAFSDVPRLMDALSAVPEKELISVRGGISKGDPCEAMAYHGYNGIEQEVVTRIADWINASMGRKQ
ncbi:alpha/beta hydrolase [Herbaspirillum rhizosphaerae]|uniref:alpha/beta hydrolase n=1 Tax=Herbaspirillum rhizosphaerae TaxID=346179 RepID=UPI00067DF536|nr:CocE/NonD family hydrolase [Herbaspirillum rhizosphaerae]